jgi:hypothetical protein
LLHLALRTWLSGPRYLALTTDGHRQSWSIFGSHDWRSQTDRRTDATSDFIYKIVAWWILAPR